MLVTVHNILEIFTIVIGIIVSFITWHSIRKSDTNHNYIKGKLVSLSILCTSILDLLHLLSYSANNPADNSWIIYWMIARILWAYTLLYAISLTLKSPNFADVILLYTASLLSIGLLTGLLTQFQFQL